MKITNVEVFLTGTAWRNFLFVKLTTDEGLVGWGDGTLEWLAAPEGALAFARGPAFVCVVNMSPDPVAPRAGR